MKENRFSARLAILLLILTAAALCFFACDGGSGAADVTASDVTASDVTASDVTASDVTASDVTIPDAATDTADPDGTDAPEASPEGNTEVPTEASTEADPEPALQELVIDAENTARILVAYYKQNPASDSIYHSAVNFGKIIRSKTGIAIKTTRVRQTSSNDAITFLIGDTPYEETARVREALPDNSYTVQIIGRKIVIIGSSETLTVKALKEFCTRVLDNAELTGEGRITIRPEDCFTVTSEKPYSIADMAADGLILTSDYTEILNYAGKGQYRVAQGAASDGTFAYLALRNSDDSGSVIAKFRLDDGSFVAVSDVLDLGHANDMTFNTAKKLLVVAHGQKEGKILTLVDPETLAFIEDVDIEKGAGAITYRPGTNSYAISQGGKSLHMLDAELTYVESFERTKPSSYTAQGMGSDEEYIYFPMSGSGQNILDTFSWAGERVAQIIIPTGYESESLFYVNGRYYVSFNHNGATLCEIFFRCILPEA